MYYRHRLAALLLACVPLGALAQNAPSATESSYLGSLLGYTRADHRRGPNVRKASTVEFFYGQQGKDRFGYEVLMFGDTFETGQSNTTDFYRYGAGVDLTYAFSDRRAFTPFAMLGAGLDHNDVFPDSGDKYSYYANAGVGFVTAPLTERGQLKLRGEARYVYDGYQSHMNDYRLALGVEIPLFEETTYAVNKDGERVRVVHVTERVPTGLTDSDEDGVTDAADRCPDTPHGTRVDGDGCPLGKVIELRGVTFETDKSRLRPDAETILTWAAGILKKYPDMQVEVAGHTDSQGSDGHNERLSLRRAQAVVNFLVYAGASKSQLSAKGYGESEPVADNDTAEGREHNRRVELRILN